MQTLDLDIEHRIGPDSQTEGRLDVVRKPLLVALLDGGPLLAELGILGEVEQALELVEVLEPDVLLELERLGDEVTEFGVALIEPSTRGNAVGHVREPGGSCQYMRQRLAVRCLLANTFELDEVLQDGGSNEVAVKLHPPLGAILRVRVR